MTSSSASNWQDGLAQQLGRQLPFSLLPSPDLSAWVQHSRRVRYEPGHQLLRPDELNQDVILVLKGYVRLIAFGDEREGSFTLDKRGPGQIIGLGKLSKRSPTEFVQASTDVIALKLPGKEFIRFVQDIPEFSDYFGQLTNKHEAYSIAVKSAELQPQLPIDWREGLINRVTEAKTYSLSAEQSLKTLPEIPSEWSWHLSTPEVPGISVGTKLKPTDEKLPERKGFQLPYRYIALPNGKINSKEQTISEMIELANEEEIQPMDLQQLGILEDDHLEDDERYPLIRGKGSKNEALAVCEMIALHQQVPFRRDTIQKVLEGQFRRDKGLSLELMAGLCELLGLSSQLAKTATRM